MGEQRHIRFKQSDVMRAAKGMRQAGFDDFTVRIDAAGTIEIVASSTAQAIAKKKGSSWDDVLKP